MTLAERDIDARVGHRSLEARRIDLESQHKIGPAALRMAAQGLASERPDEHHASARANGEKLIANPVRALDAITRPHATLLPSAPRRRSASIVITPRFITRKRAPI